MKEIARNRPSELLSDRESFERGGEAAVYARLSDAKVGRETSIEDQVRECREEARRDGNFIPDSNIFTDVDIRGATESRPGLDRLLNLVRSGRANFTDLYSADTSRLARSSSYAPKLRKFFKSHGIRLHFVENGMKSGTSGFDLQHTFQSYIDELYSEQLGEKVSRAQVGLFQKGYLPSGRCYGYRHENDLHPTKIGKWGRPVVIGVRQVPFKPEVDVILEIFRMYANGEGGYLEIARKLQARGVPHPRKGKKNEGNGWNESTIQRILNNERYIGHPTFRRTRIYRDTETLKMVQEKRDKSEWLTYHNPDLQIVSTELWDKVKARQALVRNKIGFQKAGGLARKPSGHISLFSGLLHCKCGSTMTLTHGRYMCRKALRKMGCENRQVVSRTSLEKHLIEALVSSIRSEAHMAEIRDLFMSQVAAELKERQARGDEVRSEKRALTEEKNQLEAALSNLAEEVASYGGNDALRAAMRTKSARLKAVVDILERAERSSTEYSEQDITLFLRDALTNLGNVLIGEPLKAKQELLKRVGSLTLSPLEVDGEPAFEITGDLTMFSEEEALQLPCFGTSTTELQPVKFSLSDFVLRLDSRGKVVAVTRSPGGKLDEALEDASEVAENDTTIAAWLPGWVAPDARLETTG